MDASARKRLLLVDAAGISFLVAPGWSPNRGLNYSLYPCDSGAGERDRRSGLQGQRKRRFFVRPQVPAEAVQYAAFHAGNRHALVGEFLRLPRFAFRSDWTPRGVLVQLEFCPVWR
jgi:hypothetical protein